MDVVNSTLLMLALLMLTFLLYNWILKSRNYWSSRGIPCLPGALPIIGNGLSIFSLSANTSIFSKNVYDAYKNKSMVGFYSLWNPVLMVIHPDLVKTVMQTSFNSFQHNSLTMNLETDPLIGRDPIFMRGSGWKKSRTAFSAALTAKRVKNNMCPIIEDVCKKLKDHLAKEIKGKDYLDLDVKFLFGRYTSDIAAGTVFGMEGNSFASDYQGTFLDNMKIMLDVTKSNTLKHLIIFFVPALSKVIKTRFVPLQVDRYFRSIMKSLEDSRLKNGTPGDDVLQLMLDMEKEGKIEKIDVIAYTFAFFFLSYETSNIALSFITYFVAKHKDVQHRLREEVKTVMDKHENRLTYEAINDMVYLDQVMNETLRFFPPSGVLSKVCTEPYRLDGHDGLSVEVQPGTTILIPVLGLHMDPEFWENPEEFNPERFEKSKSEGRHKFIYLPFGNGGRVCPGQRLTLTQLKAAIATMVRNHQIEVAPKMVDPIRIDPGYFMITALGGFWMRLRPLESN